MGLYLKVRPRGKRTGALAPPVNFSYSSFHLWREWLAKKVGITLNDMKGFSEKATTPWTKKERFYELLDHSDCEGSLHFKDCVELQQDFVWAEEHLDFSEDEEYMVMRYGQVKNLFDLAVTNRTYIEFT